MLAVRIVLRSGWRVPDQVQWDAGGQVIPAPIEWVVTIETVDGPIDLVVSADSATSAATWAESQGLGRPVALRRRE